jgi:hypothetical protein
MALKQNHSIQFHNKNVVFENCYFKVSQVSATKEKAVATVHAMTESGGSVIDRKDYTFICSLNGENFIAQAYNHLKTLDEFSSAVDC